MAHAEGKVVEFALGILKKSQFHPASKNNGAKFVVFSSAILASVVSALICRKLFETDNDVKLFALTLESFMTVNQLTTRMAVLLLNRGKILTLVEDTGKFWTLGGFERGVQEEMARVFDYGLMYSRGFYYAVIITINVTFFMPLITGSDELPFPSWYPEGWGFMYPILYAMQGLLILEHIHVICGFDALYTGFCSAILVQFKLLNQVVGCYGRRLRNHGEEIENLKRAIQHHNFLLGFSKDVLELYSMFILSQYFVTLLMLCMDLYMMSESSGDYTLLIKSVMYVGGLVFQLGVYCFQASFITDEASRISESMYLSEWCDQNLKNSGIHVIMVLMRSQKALTFSAGNLFGVTRKSYADVFKMAFSFYTLMKSLK